VHFEIAHELEIPRDAVELAVLSPTLVERLAPKLSAIDTVTQRRFTLEDGKLDRVWFYQAQVKIPSFAEKYVTREMVAWEEHSQYTLSKHAGSWTITPNVKPEWQKYVRAAGTYSLVATGEAKTKRVVEGDVELFVPAVFKQIAERMIIAEVRKTFEAEAAVLRDLATLA
jgi:hypothetical protein